MNIMQVLDLMRDATLQNKNLTEIFGDRVKAIPDLYRGDSIDRKRFPLEDWRSKGDTFCELIVSEGVVSKFHDGHSNLSVLTKETEFLVSCHVGYKTPNKEEQTGASVPEEVRISKFSPFISFSEKIEQSAHFQNRDNKYQIEECDYENATHFIFKLSGLLGYEYKKGMFLCACKPSTENVNKMNADRLNRAKEDFTNTLNPESICKALGESAALSNVKNFNSVLVLTAIHVDTYLKNNNTVNIAPELVKRSIERANKWNEWLIYPGLPGTTDGHYQKIPPCKELSIENYGKEK